MPEYVRQRSHETCVKLCWDFAHAVGQAKRLALGCLLLNLGRRLRFLFGTTLGRLYVYRETTQSCPNDECYKTLTINYKSKEK